MRSLHSLRPATLILLGTIVMGVGAWLRQAGVRGGSATDLSDFGLGAVAGIGIGLLLLGVWISHRRNRGTRAS